MLLFDWVVEWRVVDRLTQGCVEEEIWKVGFLRWAAGKWCPLELPLQGRRFQKALQPVDRAEWAHEIKFNIAYFYNWPLFNQQTRVFKKETFFLRQSIQNRWHKWYRSLKSCNCFNGIPILLLTVLEKSEIQVLCRYSAFNLGLRHSALQVWQLTSPSLTAVMLHFTSLLPT